MSEGHGLNAATAGIALVKPNRPEFEELVRRPLPTLGDVIDAARDLIAQGCAAALVSLGADGALYVDAATAAHAEARIADAANPVGAGDTFGVAGSQPVQDRVHKRRSGHAESVVAGQWPRQSGFHSSSVLHRSFIAFESL